MVLFASLAGLSRQKIKQITYNCNILKPVKKRIKCGLACFLYASFGKKVHAVYPCVDFGDTIPHHLTDKVQPVSLGLSLPRKHA